MVVSYYVRAGSRTWVPCKNIQKSISPAPLSESKQTNVDAFLLFLSTSGYSGSSAGPQQLHHSPAPSQGLMTSHPKAGVTLDLPGEKQSLKMCMMLRMEQPESFSKLYVSVGSSSFLPDVCPRQLKYPRVKVYMLVYIKVYSATHSSYKVQMMQVPINGGVLNQDTHWDISHKKEWYTDILQHGCMLCSVRDSSYRWLYFPLGMQIRGNYSVKKWISAFLGQRQKTK